MSKHTIDRRTFLALTAAGGGVAFMSGLFGQAQAAYVREIVLKAGEPVVLELKAIDFVHGFSVPDFKLRADLVPGQVVRLSFMPTAPGTIDFLCDNFRGSGHEEMNGKFIVKA